MTVSTLVETVGDASANTYGTLAEAETYFADRLYADLWLAASDDVKKQALLFATKVMDTQITWKGFRTTSNQALSWPRIYVPNYDLAQDAVIAYLDSTIIPAFIKNSQFELALSLLAEDSTTDSDTDGLKSIKVGSIALEIDNLTKKQTLPKQVLDIITRYGTAHGSSASVRLVRS